MQVNETFLKISSKIPFALPIQLGDDLVITVSGQNYIFNAVKLEVNDRQDGSVNHTYTLKSLIE